MNRNQEEFEKNYTRKLRSYLEGRNEKVLNEAYEWGRRAVDDDLGVLELIKLYQNAIQIIESGNNVSDLVTQRRNLSFEFLTECLAAYDLQQRGFKSLIQKMNTQNEILQEEVERRKESELELEKSKEHFQNLIENSLDIVTILKYDGTISFESPSLERILGYTPEELIGNSAFDYIHPDDLPQIQQKLAGITKSLGNIDNAQFRFRHKMGHWRYLESIAKNVTDSIEGPCVIVNSRDVTERVHSHEKLIQSQSQLTTAQEIAKLGSWEWDVLTNHLNWSEMLCNIYGLPFDNYPNSYDEYIQTIYPDDRDMVDNLIKQAINERSSFEFEHRIQRSDGSLRTLYCRGEIETDIGGEPVKMIGIGHDITRMKRAEEKLKKYSRQLSNLTAKQEKIREEERTRIARELHDELGQMLTVLKMDVSLAVQKSKAKFGDKYISKFSNEIENIIDRIDTIINSVQRITSELRPDLLDDLGLAEAMELQSSKFESRTGLDINFSNNKSLLNKLNDESSTTVYRIFQECLTNVYRHANATKVEIEINQEQDDLILVIKDNGRGISKKEIDHPDSLGITGMKERSMYLGGDISISGEPGIGTTVKLKIPLKYTINEKTKW